MWITSRPETLLWLEALLALGRPLDRWSIDRAGVMLEREGWFAREAA
jgi:hypothetical protein